MRAALQLYNVLVPHAERVRVGAMSPYMKDKFSLCYRDASHATV